MGRGGNQLDNMKFRSRATLLGSVGYLVTRLFHLSLGLPYKISYKKLIVSIFIKKVRRKLLEDLM